MERDQATKFVNDLLKLMVSRGGSDPVSYTHLTLPTILRV